MLKIPPNLCGLLLWLSLSPIPCHRWHWFDLFHLLNWNYPGSYPLHYSHAWLNYVIYLMTLSTPQMVFFHQPQVVGISKTTIISSTLYFAPVFRSLAILQTTLVILSLIGLLLGHVFHYIKLQALKITTTIVKQFLNLIYWNQSCFFEIYVLPRDQLLSLLITPCLPDLPIFECFHNLCYQLY